MMDAPPASTKDLSDLAHMLVTLGCPAEKSLGMAAMIEKRAHQLATERGQAYHDALAYLLGLMRQGWAAKVRGF